MWSVRPKAIAGVRGSNFFSLGLGQKQTKGTVRTGPVVDGQAPPAEGDFAVRATRKGQGAPNLVGAHATSRTIAPLNGRGIGFGIAQALQRLLDSAPGTMRVADVHVHDPVALA